ncbi:hypothetical protein [Lysinibacillus capsici]|uniref:hypothetical protein n=1 Tax=Lysinibacillus capsici TaxID=2115968 RepID=UPI003BA9AF0E
MKGYELGLTICVLLTFTLTMIIIFTGVFINFFSIEDFTIIAALIGVIAAIVGGVISGGLTLLGVRYTIKHENDIRMKDQIPQKIELLRKSRSLIKTIIIKTSTNRKHVPTMVFSHFKEGQDILYDYASKIDHDCYNQLLKIENTINEYNNLDFDRALSDDGQIVYTYDALLVLEKYKTFINDYEKLMQNKMMYYQTELSK